MARKKGSIGKRIQKTTKGWGKSVAKRASAAKKSVAKGAAVAGGKAKMAFGAMKNKVAKGKDEEE